MTDTTHALMYGELNSVDDIIDAVEQEQDHDKRFHSCRVLIREVKRLRVMYEEANRHLDLMVERFGIEALVEMVGDEE